MEYPEWLGNRASEMFAMESDGADKRRLWAVILGLTPVRDGNQMNQSHQRRTYLHCRTS